MNVAISWYNIQDMETITLVGQTPGRKLIEAIFAPEKGMNLISFKVGNISLIDQTTKTLFDERAAGLGALIGPHFHHRPKNQIPLVKDLKLFPHLALMKERGIEEPFSHGIARYVPWKVTNVAKDSLRAELKGSMNYRGVRLKDLEGFDFQMTFEARIIERGIYVDLQISGTRPSVVGLHYYYALKGGRGRVTSRVCPAVREADGWKHFPIDEKSHTMTFPCDRAFDGGFMPYPYGKIGWIELVTGDMQVNVSYVTPTEGSWQLWHPEKASFVCIEPLSAIDPRKPKNKVNGLAACIQVEEK